MLSYLITAKIRIQNHKIKINIKINKFINGEIIKILLFYVYYFD